MVEENRMEDDLFVDDTFSYEKVFELTNKKDPTVKTKYTFKFKEITGADSDRISKGAMKVNGRTGEMELNQSEANIKFLRASLIEAPFAITDDNIRKLSKKIRDELIEFARQINSIEDVTEKK